MINDISYNIYNSQLILWSEVAINCMILYQLNCNQLSCSAVWILVLLETESSVPRPRGCVCVCVLWACPAIVQWVYCVTLTLTSHVPVSSPTMQEARRHTHTHFWGGWLWEAGVSFHALLSHLQELEKKTCHLHTYIILPATVWSYLIQSAF